MLIQGLLVGGEPRAYGAAALRRPRSDRRSSRRRRRRRARSRAPVPPEIRRTSKDARDEHADAHPRVHAAAGRWCARGRCASPPSASGTPCSPLQYSAKSWTAYELELPVDRRAARIRARGTTATRTGRSVGTSRTAVSGRTVRGVDLDRPRQRRRAAEQLLVEPVAPPADRLREREPGHDRVGDVGEHQAAPAADDPRPRSRRRSTAPQMPRPPFQIWTVRSQWPSNSW